MTPAAVAALAYAAVLASAPRTPSRRAAVAVYYSATVGKPRTLAAVRRAITDTYELPDTRQGALELLDSLTQLADLAEPEEQTA